MVENVASLLTPWSNFYVMTGAAAASLTGLMFVVITLVNRGDRASMGAGMGSFSTPTVLHFSAALLISALLIAPWPSLIPLAVLLALSGLYGIFHVFTASRQTQPTGTYRPDLADLISYTILPLIAYSSLTIGALGLLAFPLYGLFAIAFSPSFLIAIGIRNAWDMITYLVTGGPEASGATTVELQIELSDAQAVGPEATQAE